MSKNDPLPLELREVETRLARLAPMPPRLDRDRVMYEAGRAAAIAPPVADPGASAARNWRRVALGLAACLAVSTSLSIFAYATRPDAERRVVYVQQPERANGVPPAGVEPTDNPAASADPPTVAAYGWRRASQSASSSGPPTYLDERNLVLREGIDALPLPRMGSVERAPAAPAPTVRELLKELLPQSATS